MSKATIVIALSVGALALVWAVLLMSGSEKRDVPAAAPAHEAQDANGDLFFDDN